MRQSAKGYSTSRPGFAGPSIMTLWRAGSTGTAVVHSNRTRCMADETDTAQEANLLAGLQRHDPQAFEMFFQTHVDRVYRIAVGILGNDADAQEVVQATFLSAFEAVDRFEPRARLGTWL